MLERIPLHITEIETALQEQGIPEWIKYLPLAESRLQSRAVSPAGAVGIWQIMPATGRSLGLRINDKIDERLHTGLASKAAALYLKKLHRQFGDWLLALAAYNCGAGNVRKAQRRAKGYFYHEISRYLPRQTRRYIPRVLTIARVAQQPAAHGFTDVRPLAQPVIVTSTQPTSLKELAHYFSCSLSLLKKFNPTYSNSIRVNGETTAAIYIPASVYNTPVRTQPLRIGTALQVRAGLRTQAHLGLPNHNGVIALRQNTVATPWYSLLAFTSATLSIGG